MTTNAPRIRSIFLTAVESVEPDQWPTYLDEQCEGDAELRRQVEILLQAHQQANSLLDAPPMATVDGPPIAERPGSIIGPYRLLQQIGEGGMGVVWMAEQTEPVKRKVALKVIKPGMDSRQVIARFEAERQALALMDHVNIARVFDGGTVGSGQWAVGSEQWAVSSGRKADASALPTAHCPLTTAGRPYFVMELVHGVPITKYCDDNHLTPRERLELFVPVCQAIQHAHQKGIIHRDIKPSNVMVTLYDGKPVPKVIDFGVAKATEQKLTERTLFTQYGTMVGTLEYMSPEQAEMSALGVDTRSDIYSLGVLLYELLTGSTPLTHKRMKEAAYAEILRMIKEEEPPKPSTRLSELSSPHAPREEPGLGSRSEPATLASIAAQRSMEPAKLTKLVKGELDWIVMKCLEKDRNRRYETANGFAADVQRYLADEPVQACPPSAGYRFRKFARRNKRAFASAAVLAMAVLVVAGTVGWAVRDREAHAQEAARERAARQASIEQEVNLALKEAEQWREQARWPEALSAAKRAEGLLANDGNDELRERVQELRKDLEMVLRLEEIPVLRSEFHENKFDYESADRAYAKAFADYGIDVAGLSTEDAAARIRARVGVALALSAALDDWAFARSKGDRAGGLRLQAVAQTADPDSWRRHVREAVKQEDGKKLAALAASPERLRQPPISLLMLARALLFRNLVETQIEVLGQAQRQYPGDFWINFSLGTALNKMGPPSRNDAVSFLRAALAIRPWSIAALNNLGIALRIQKKLNEAVACFQKAIGLDPTCVNAHVGLGMALRDEGQLEEAIACYKKALELDSKHILAHVNLGIVLNDQGQLEEAIACHKRALELNPNSVPSYNNFGRALYDQGKVEEAIACYKKAIELDPKNVYAHNSLGNALHGQKKLDQAIAFYRKALELDPTYVNAHIGLGIALKMQGKLNDAIACYRKAIELDPKNADVHHNLGLALNAQGHFEETIACYHKTLELDPKYVGAHIGLGTVLRVRGKLEESIAANRKAIELDPKKAIAHNNLGLALYDQKKLDDAIACFQKAIELDPEYASAYGGLGDALRAQGKVDEAITVYRKAIELDPNDSLSHNGLGNALVKQKQVDDAIACYRKAIELDPKSAWPRYNLGNLLIDQNKLEEAIACYQKAIELDPKHALAHNNLGNALSAQGRSDEALTFYRKAIELDPKDAMVRRNLGGGLKAQGKLDEAIATYRKAIDLDPKNVVAHRNLGELLVCKGQVDAAITELREAIRLDLKDFLAHHILGNILCDSKRDYDGAIVAQREAIRLKPDHALAHRNLGIPLYHKGLLDEAIAAYRKAVELNPKDANAHYNLGIALFKKGAVDDALTAYHEAIRLKVAGTDVRNAIALRLNNRAWGLATNPDPASRDAKRAMELAKEAVEINQKGGTFWNTLGVAHYRAGNWNEAITALQKSMDLRNGGDANDWFFMAMAYRQVGNEARKRYDRAVEWTEKNQPKNEQLSCFRAEAAELLGIEKKRD